MSGLREAYVIQTTCPNCGHVERTNTTVEALSKARDWARNRSFEGVLPEAAGLREAVDDPHPEDRPRYDRKEADRG